MEITWTLGCQDVPEIEFPASAGAVPCYLAVPAFERGLATIVLQERAGLDDHIRSVCDRLASEGFSRSPRTSTGARPPGEARQDRR